MTPRSEQPMNAPGPAASEQQLDVVLYDAVIGTLHRATTASRPKFTYSQRYVEEGTVPLSVALPIRAQTYDPPAVTPFLEGLLPENAETRKRWAQRLDASGDDAFALLARMGWDCPGAVQFAAADDVDAMQARAHDLTEVDEHDIAQRLRDLRQDEASWTMPDEHWSLPGQQPKFALTQLGDRWHEANGSAATTHIIKPGIGRLHQQALVEHLTMRAAYLVGVDVATTSFQRFEDEAAIVVARFDRIVTDDDVLRIHQEDLCSATGTLPERKHESDNGPGIVSFMRMIDKISTDPKKDAEALADFAAFNYVAGAPDGHSKNISLRLVPGRTFVAPLYDLATSFPYERKGEHYLQVALSIGGRRKLGQVMPKNWDKADEQMRLPNGYLRDRARDLAETLPDAMITALDEVDDDAIDDIRDRMMPRLEWHCAELLATLAASSLDT